LQPFISSIIDRRLAAGTLSAVAWLLVLPAAL